MIAAADDDANQEGGSFEDAPPTTAGGLPTASADAGPLSARRKWQPAAPNPPHQDLYGGMIGTTGITDYVDGSGIFDYDYYGNGYLGSGRFGNDDSFWSTNIGGEYDDLQLYDARWHSLQLVGPLTTSREALGTWVPRPAAWDP